VYTIKQASARTGLGAPLIRAWERRYGVVAPIRTPAGYRMYDEAAIEVLLAMRGLVDRGWTASEAARAITAGEVAVGDVAIEPPAGSEPGMSSAAARRTRVIDRFVAAAESTSPAEIEAAIDEILASGSFEAVVDDLLLPAAAAIGDSWAAGRLGGVTVWFTGLSGSGKSTISNEVARLLAADGRAAYLLDGDNLRFGLNGDLGFDRASREENVRRVGEVARLMADAGLAALVPVISPYREGRDRVREIHDAAGLRFVEVFVDTPIEECEQRDPKGLYAKARRGELKNFTGIDSPYEPPPQAELRIDTTAHTPASAAELVLVALQQRRIVDDV
jgi:bifunctional enzyme CysN/CysC